MKLLGIIGGLGPESTVEYYKLLNAVWREQRPDGSYPRFVLANLDLKEGLALVTAGELEKLTAFLEEGVQTLVRAGATFGLIAANTPHIVFDELSHRSSMPLLSIVDAARDEAARLGLKRLALFGTGFTMRARFYPQGFERAGLTIVPPDAPDRDFIHDKYLNELIPGIVLDETRARLLEIAGRMKREKAIDGLLLGGTELTLIFRDPEVHGLPVLDTTQIHVRAAVAEMLRPIP